MQVQVWERKPFATVGYNQRFIYSVFTKDTLDEKGQARDTKYLDTVNVKHTLSCTRPNKLAAKGVGVLYLGVAGRRAWPKSWEGPLMFYIIYTKQQDKTTPARVGNHTCERPTTVYGVSLGPIYTGNNRSCHRPA